MPDMNPQPEPEGESIRDMLTAGFDAAAASADPKSESEAATPQPGGSAADDAPAATTTTSEAPAAGAAKADHPTDPNRYADGTFKKSKADRADAAPAKAAPETEIPSTDAAKASTEPASKPTSAPPAGWTAAAKAEWSKLPPSVQADVSRREAEMSRGGEQWSEQKQRYEAVLAPVARAASRYGLTAEQGLNALLAAQQALEQDPANAIRDLARRHGVDIATLAGQPASEVSRETTPDIATLVQRVVQPILAPIQSRFAAEDQRRESSVATFVSEFAAAPGHEHFGAVEDHLLSLIPQVQRMNPGWTHQQVLQEAYDQAVWANPTTRQAMTEAQQQAAEAARIAAAKARASSARTAAASLTGAPTGTNGATAPKDSLRAELEAAFAAAR